MEELNDTTGNTGLPQVGSGDENLNLPSTNPDPSELAQQNSTRLEITNLNRTVFDKTLFNETIDTSFSELGDTNQPDPSFFDINLATQDNFFTLYEKFFFEIPKMGISNSHEYLVKKSGDYINFERDQQAIQELLDEIAELRIENVDLRILNVNLEVASITPTLKP
tara:strand:+ start:1113 stop:1610 length:498 start_codon:yes stop_codon:yes gene_type:complete